LQPRGHEQFADEHVRLADESHQLCLWLWLDEISYPVRRSWAVIGTKKPIGSPSRLISIALT
jgi:hypothetical protein